MPEVEKSLWRVAKHTCKDTPVQTNGSNCAVLQMMTMDYLCEDLPFDFGVNDCARFRKQIALALLNNHLE